MDVMMEIEINKTYEINHTRKGRFIIRVTKQDERWITGILQAGKPKMINHKNDILDGEEITVRKSFCTFAPFPNPNL